MRKIISLLATLLLLNGCAESMALLGPASSAIGGGNVVQSSLTSVTDYAIKKSTGKNALEHATSYLKKNNPDKKKETCISFIEKTRSEFCSIAKKKISTTNQIVKDKIVSKIRKDNKDTNQYTVNKSNQTKKTPRELAIDFQNELIKKTKDKYQSIKFYLVSR